MHIPHVIAAALLGAAPVVAQTPTDPFPPPIPAVDGVITVDVVEFASIPDIGGRAARMMLLVDEPGTGRMFVNDMRGPLYTISYDGKAVTTYLDINAPDWRVRVQSNGNERGFQSFVFHPQFSQPDTRGFGRFYTYTDTSNTTPPADFTAAGASATTHDTVLLEWTARTPGAATYDGGAPRELLRWRQPFPNHNAGGLSFNPIASPGSAEFGLLYIGAADGGSGGDPLRLAQNLDSAFGKILRIDPLGTNSTNGNYGIPAGNPFVDDGNAETLGEIYAYGLRNPQRLAWDTKTKMMFVADIGQNIVEEISPVTAGANLGWNDWEGSFEYVSRTEVRLTNQRGDLNVTYPIVEYGQVDPLLQNQSAVTGIIVYRSSAIPELANLLLFGDNPSGEVFYANADTLPIGGGQNAVHRVLFNDGGAPKTLLKLIRAKNVAQGKSPATRVDLRFGAGPNSQVLLLNKRDGTIRLIVR